MKFVLRLVFLFLTTFICYNATAQPYIEYPQSQKFFVGRYYSNSAAPYKVGGTFPGGYNPRSMDFATPDVTFDGKYFVLSTMHAYTFYNRILYKSANHGATVVVAGNGESASVDGTGADARFRNITGMALDNDLNTYLAETNEIDNRDCRIRKITSFGVVSTLTRNLNGVGAFAIGSDKVLYCFNNDGLLKIDQSGVVSVIVKSLPAIDGNKEEITGMAVDKLGNVYLADKAHKRIIKVTTEKTVFTFAGSDAGDKDGIGLSAKFSDIGSIGFDSKGTLWVSDKGNGKLKKVNADGLVTTISKGRIYTNTNQPTTEYLPSVFCINPYDFISYFSNGAYKQLNTYGYSIDEALPDGITLNTDGSMGGVPTKVTPAKEYTISASTPFGVAKGKITIEVLADGLRPTVTSFTPVKAPALATVTITGTNFTGATKVTFGPIEAESFQVISPTEIKAVTPIRGASGIVSVTTPWGNDYKDGFIHMSPPVVETIATLLAGTGSSVSIYGSNMTDAEVTVGGIPAQLTFKNDLFTQFIMPDGATSGDIKVTTPYGSAIFSTLSFVPKPEITSISPSAAGYGEHVIITGKNFDYINYITFGGLNAQAFTKVSSTVIDAVVGKGKGGTVVVSTIGGKAEKSGFTYKGAEVYSFSPTSAASGQTVTLKGAGFTGATRVTFGGFDAASFTIISDTEIKAVVGQGQSGEIGVTGINGASYFGYFVHPGPVITTTSGYWSGPFVSSPIQINGANFAGATSVTLGGVPVSSFSVSGTTQIVAYPAANTVSGELVVITPLGTGKVPFTWAKPPVITSVSPLTGKEGDRITVRGSNLTTVTHITIGGNRAKSVSVTSDTTMTFLLGVNPFGTIVFNNFGGSTPYKGFNLSAPAIASITPAKGGTGTEISVAGTNLSTTTVVKIGNIPVEIISKTDNLLKIKAAGEASGAITVQTEGGEVTYGNFQWTEAPIISYSNNTQTYTQGTAISPMVIANTGGAVPAVNYGQASSIVGNGSGMPGWASFIDLLGTAPNYFEPSGLAVDAVGNLYVADINNHIIRKITPAGIATIWAGSGSQGNSNGTGTAASFNRPAGMTIDAAGNLYVADGGNHLIRKITTAGVVTTIAGSGNYGSNNGTALTARFASPAGVAVDAAGNVYVADRGNHLIRKIDVFGVVSTLAGSGALGNSNGTGTAASFSEPNGVAVDAAGNVYVADMSNRLIRKITPAGVVSTFAGSGDPGTTNGLGTAASFTSPYSIAIDAIGNLYVAEEGGVQVPRRITPAGLVTTIEGNGSWGKTDDIIPGFGSSHGVAVDPAGSVYVSDYSNGMVRRIRLTGYTVSPALPAGLNFDATTGTISGTPTVASAPATYTITAYNMSGSSNATVTLRVNLAGTLPPVAAPAITYASDTQVYIAGTAIGSLSPTNTGGAVPATIYGQVTTFAGSGAQGKANGNGTTASFNLPFGIAADVTGSAYVADEGNNLIRKITLTGAVSTFAGSGTIGSLNGTGASASFNHPHGVTVDAFGRAYVADYGNNKIRHITASGLVSTLAGDGNVGNSNGNSAASANFYHPMGVSVDASGNVYVADEGNNLIRKITSAGVVSIFAGSTNGAGKVNGTGTSASFNGPAGVATDISGNVYVADYANSLIRKISPAGVVTTLAGSSSWGNVNDIGILASFRLPEGVAVDAEGNVYVADSGNNLIRKINSAGVVTTLAGSGAYGGANGTGTAASFNFPTGVAVDGAGSLLVADAGNNQIRKVSITGYTISAALPAGLSFDVTTGIISGTPTAVSAPKTYTITAYNAGGSSSVNITIAVGNSKSSGTLPGKNYGDAYFSAAASGTGPFTYHSSNPSVATISDNGLVHIAGAGTTNFVISDGSHINTQSLTVSKMPLTIAANNQSRTYGAANPTLTATYTGFVNGDTEASFITQPTVATTATVTSAVDAYPITISGAVSNNYAITYTNGTLTVSKAPVTITADNQNKIYGADNPGLTLSYSGLVLGESIAVFSNQATISTTATKTSAVGSYTILLTGATANNYAFLYNNATLTVNKAPLTIAANNQNKTYGAINPVLTAAYSGFVNGETASVLAIQPTIVTTANATSSTGTYPITVSGATSGNYTISYTNGALTVNKASLTIRADNQTKYQGDANPVLTASYSGFVNGDTKAQLTTQPVISTAATTMSSSGVYPITVSGAVSNNYSFSYLSGTLTVGQEAITFNPIAARTYGGATFSAGASGDGAVNYSSSNPSVAIVDNGQIRIMGAGTTTITVGDGTHIKTQNLTINKAPLTITAGNQSKTYGAANPTLTATYSGFVNGDTQAQLSTQATLSTTAVTGSAAGAYPITVTGAASNNYAIIYANATLTVDKAPLTITANNQSKTYGAANPAFTASFIGFVNGDAQAQLTTQAILSTTAVTGSAAGAYPITVTGAASNNYAITYANGTLTVDKALLTITANNQSKTYGAANPTLTLTYSGFVNGETSLILTQQPVVATTATAASGAGVYEIVASGAVTDNYDITYNNGKLTVTKDKPVISFPAIAAHRYGDVDIELAATSNNTGVTLKYSVDNPAVTMIVNNKIHILKAGAVKVTASQEGNDFYEPAESVQQTIVINKATLVVTADDKTKVAGKPNPAFTLTYSGFVNGETSAIITQQPVVATTATSSSGAGIYDIVASGAAASNYDITYNNGKLTVTKDKSVITFPSITARRYGDADIELSAGSTNTGVPLTYSVDKPDVASVVNNKIHILKAGAVKVTVSQEGSDFYEPAESVQQTLLIDKAALVITADDKTRAVGKPDPAFTVTYQGFVKGETSAILGQSPVITITATAASVAGIYDIVPSGAVSDNYGFTYNTGKLFITPALDNLKVSATDVTCKGQGNGIIAIIAKQTASYTAVLTGNSINKSYTFTTDLNIDNLSPGIYNVCVSDAALPGQKRCFDLTIAEPKDLSVYAAVVKNTSLLNISLAGGNQYQVTLNGRIYSTRNNSITLELNRGSNKLEVATDKDCQGKIEQIINYSGNPVPYPNPFSNELFVNVGVDNVNAAIKIYSVADGSLKLAEQFKNVSGVIKLDVSKLKMGVYSVHVTKGSIVSVYKVIKQ
jgi:sugar lactone lactonase YvrE